MLDNLLSEFIELVPAQNNPPFSDDGIYDSMSREKEKLIDEWKLLSPKEQEKYKKNIKNYFKQKGLTDPSSVSLGPSKNYSLLQNEVATRISVNDPSILLPINDLHFEQSILELVENMENTDHIRELYKLKKHTVGRTKNAGINADEAFRIKNCMRQGRELYLAGKAGSLMVKPLNYFYSLTAYSYALIILNNPIRYSLDSLPGSHGVNYMPEGMKTQVGGNMPQGTFSDLVCAFPTINSQAADFSIQQDCTASILAFYNTRHTVGVGTLLSMIPEIREYYKIATNNTGRTHPLSASFKRDGQSVFWEFKIGDGVCRPDVADVKKAFGDFSLGEIDGKFLIRVPTSQASKLRATIYCDTRGNLWYIENPFFPVLFPEICIHFLLTNTLSNLMRYSPDHWGSVLLNETNSNQSLIIRKYLSAFENKFPILLLRALSKYFPYVAGGNFLHRR